MKFVYGAAVVVVVFLLYTAFSKVPPPDTLTVNDMVFEVEKTSGETVSYTSPTTRGRLLLMQFESDPNVDPYAVLDKKLTKQGATRVGKGRYWLKESPTTLSRSETMTHISITCVGTSVTQIHFTENIAGALYSEETFRELERIGKDVPRPTRRFQTWF